MIIIVTLNIIEFQEIMHNMTHCIYHNQLKLHIILSYNRCGIHIVKTIDKPHIITYSTGVRTNSEWLSS